MPRPQSAEITAKQLLDRIHSRFAHRRHELLFILRKRDDKLTGELSKAAFRDVLCDDLGFAADEAAVLLRHYFPLPGEPAAPRLACHSVARLADRRCHRCDAADVLTVDLEALAQSVWRMHRA